MGRARQPKGEMQTGAAFALKAAPGAEPLGLPRDMFSPTGMLALADLVPVMIAYVDRELRYRFLNKALADWLEKPRHDILGRTIREMIGYKAFQVREPWLAAALAGERKFFASELQHPTRGPVAVQTDYVPWADGDGVIQGVIITILDVSEQRTTERALRESEARFRRIANSAPVMMWVTRLDRTRDFVNDAYADFMGLSHDEARTFDWRLAIHPDDAERVVAESLAGEASLKPFSLEARYRRHDGAYRWLRSVSSPRFGTDGAHVGFIGTASDVTVAKEAQLALEAEVAARTAELAASEARFRAIFDTVLEVLVLLNPDGTIVQLNRKQERWRDPNTDDAMGRKIWEAPTFRNYPQHVPLMKRAVATAARGELFNEEVAMERDGVPTSYLDVSVQPVRDASTGQITYLLFEARDITDLKATQEQLRQAQKMEALGQLTGGLAHDFNNLLTVVVGGLDIITKRTAEPKLKRYADNALAAAERGARLTGQLLAFSRVQRLEVRATEVAPLIHGMRPLLQNVLGPGIEKRFEIDPEAGSIMADPTQLEVAMLNLAINARDAMPRGGVLTFRTRRVAIAGDPELEDGDYVEFAIADTGIGMPAEVASRAFEPFYTTKEVGKGTGLGLSMVYGMARQSGGTARIDSAPGTGTTVKLLFHVASGRAAAAEPGDTSGDAAQAASGSASILVIDDDPDVRGFVVGTLEEQGYDVRDAVDGRTGLAELAKRGADLVILDFIMPGLSGAEVAARILAATPEQRILFVSGYSETEAVRRVTPSAPLLAKPFRAEALGKAVRSVLHGAAG